MKMFIKLAALGARAGAAYGRLFPERQLFYRSGGRVYFLRLTKPLQTGIACLLLIAGGWVAYTSANLLVGDWLLVAKDRQITVMQVAYDELDQELTATRARFLAITRELEAKQQRLLELVNQKNALEQRLGSIAGELKGVAAQRDDYEATARSLSARIAKLESSLRIALAKTRSELEAESERGTEQSRPPGPRAANATLASLEAKLNDLIAERDAAMREGKAKADRLAVLENRLAELSDVERRLSDLLQERDYALREGERLAGRAELLERRLGAIKASQRDLIERIRERTETNLAEIEGMIELTGLEIEEVLQQAAAPRSGLGGPFFGLVEGDAATDFDESRGPFTSAVLELEQHLNRWAGLQNVLQRLPLTSPMDSYYVASSYGKRRDPFSKKWAMHYGVDLAGRYKSPIWSTAPGKVVFAGRKGPYGKLVEIDHGFGLRTRYGHLNKILVKKGQTVGFRDKIGLVGNTGRSTGTHVHYEVLFNGKPQDPAKFMKAGKYVFKS